MNTLTYLTAAASVIYLGMGFYAWFIDKKSPVNRLFLFACLSFFIWSFAYGFFYLVPAKQEAWFWYRISSVGWISFSSLLLHFFLLMTNRKKMLSSPLLYLWLYLPVLLFIHKSFTGVLIAVDFIPTGWGYFEVQEGKSLWYVAYFAYYSVNIFYGLHCVWQHGRKSNHRREKMQARIIVVTGLISIVLGSLSNLVLPALGIRIPALAPLLILFWAMGMWYSIVRYKLMTINSALVVEQVIARARDLIILINTEGNIIKINDQVRETIGPVADSILGKPITEIFMGDSSLLETIKNAGDDFYEKQQTRMMMATSDGAGMPVMISAAQIKDNTEDTIGIVLVCQDLRQTEALRASEESLQQSSQKLEAIISASPDGIGMSLLNGKLLLMSDKLVEMYGYSIDNKDEFIGKSIFHFIDPSSHKILIDNVAKLLTGESDHIITECLAIKKNNSRFNVDINAALLLDADGKPASFMFIERDITERKRAAAEIQRTNIHLEDAIAQANEMAMKAELANIAKSDFLANMSHEIRTPMNGVMGMTGLLLDTDLTAEQRRYAGIVQASGETLLGILNDILDFSKIEAGKLDMETLDFNLRYMLDDFAAALAMRAQEKGLEFICAASPDVPAYLKGDPGRLRQILTNLTGNAVKFTDKGEISVRASLVSETDNEAVVRFSVKDTGIGIPKHKQALMFQKFTQADTSTTRKYGGTGLGLAISKELVGLMGGEIGLISPLDSTGSPQAGQCKAGEAGQGSEFWFIVRLGKQADRERDIAPPADISDAHVLVVDDNATNREILMTQFAAWGVRGEEAPDGTEALRSLNRACEDGDPFRIAILDMQMPGMDGAELAVAIKVDEKLKDTRLVLMTSLGHRGDAKQMEQIGFAAYLQKPTRQSDLFSCLSSVLTGTKLAQTLVTRHAIREMRRGVVRILLAEDNIVNQQVAVGILKKLGLRVDAVANGAEAIAALETLPYDLVLMDVQMPVMDGLRATLEIRNSRSTVLNHDIPIIAMTAHALQGDRGKCLDAGMNDYVTKPVDPKALAEALDKWLPKEEKDEYPISNSQFPTDEVNNIGCVPSHGDEEKKEADENAPDIVQQKNKSLDIGHSQIPVFDRAALLDRVMGDEKLAHKLIDMFLDDVPKRIAELRSYLTAGDIPGSVRQAHTIKGVCANLGGERMRAVALEMEEAARAGDLKIVMGHLPELDKQFALLKQEMIPGSYQILAPT